MEFCPLCGNMLYIRHDAEDNTVLHMYCKHCNFQKDNTSTQSICISESIVNDDTSQLSLLMNPNIRYDPALPHVDNIPCPNVSCSKPADGHNDITYLRYDTTNMKYIYYCNHCGHYWKI
jgi:DNA-directed RNA polymerase subunit M/transcription elongation factor TFIIS